MTQQSPDRDPLTPFCPAYTRAIELVGRRWTGAILRSMLVGATRFGEIRAAVPSLSDRLLSERLRELESEGVIERKVIPSTPVRVEYTLTEKGRGLGSVVRAVAEWAETWAQPEPVAKEAGDAAAPAEPAQR